MTDWKSQRDLQRSATAILRSANYSASGEVKDRVWRRKRRLENGIEKRRAREREAKLLGTFGAASSVKSVNK
jgi:hypothetical protein